MITHLKANLISLSGRKNNFLIPSNSLRLVETTRRLEIGEQENTVFVILSDDDLMKRSVFVPPHMLTIIEGAIAVPLYNGGHEACYIQHEQVIATLLDYPDLKL